MGESELEKNLIKAKEEISSAEKNFEDMGVPLDKQAVYHTLKALYYQNQVLIEQNSELIKYLKESKK